MTAAADRKPAQTWALLSLLVANLVPVAGVYFWDWSLTELLRLYWLESAVIGVFTVLKMLTARLEGQSPLAHVGVKATTVPFFIFHYGLFWAVHGIFLNVIFGRAAVAAGSGSSGLLSVPLNPTTQQVDVLGWPLALMLMSHGVDFVTGYLARGDYRSSTPQQLMTQPYPRVFVLHVTIIGGAFLVLAAGQSRLLLLLFVLLKIIVDVLGHLRPDELAEAARAATT